MFIRRLLEGSQRSPALRCFVFVTSLAAALAGQMSSALACGGGFGHGLDVQPQQTIALSYRAGVETYTFRPAFCGPPSEFGLVLPIPSALEGEPVVGDPRLFEALAAMAAPEVVVKQRCSQGSKAAAPGGAPSTDAAVNRGPGTQVLDGGRVDVFEWVALQASRASDLTSWLEENGFPYDSFAETVFTSYVAAGSTFVAFKVAADALGADAGMSASICGAFGPISLRFASPAPVIPLRIAAAHAGAQQRSFFWNVYVAAESRMRAESPELDAQLYFAGTFDQARLAATPELGSFARAGDRLTELRLSFRGAELTSDLRLVVDESQDSFRRKLTVYEESCDGCSVAVGTGRPRQLAGWALCALGMLLVSRRRRRAL